MGNVWDGACSAGQHVTAKGEKSSRDLNAKESSLWFTAKISFSALPGLEHSCQLASGMVVAAQPQ